MEVFRAKGPMVVTNWTVQDAGATKAPTTNDYDQWNIQQLRKECTARGKKIARTIEDEGRVRREWLRENDRERMLTADHTTVMEMTGSTTSSPAASTVVRALNVISPYEATRKEVEVAIPTNQPETPQKPTAKRLRVEQSHTQNEVASNPVRCSTSTTTIPTPINPSALFMAVPKRSTTTKAIAPLKFSSIMRPTLSAGTSTVPETPIEVPHPTMAPIMITPKASTVVTPRKERNVCEILECISKTYAIRNQLQNNSQDPIHQRSIKLLEAGLHQLESEYAVAMGLVDVLT